MEKFIVVILSVGFLLAGFLFFLAMWRKEKRNSNYWYQEYLGTRDAISHLQDDYFSKKSKMLHDRLNHLKSDLAQLKTKKLDKTLDEFKINELSIRIHEINYLISKL